MFDALSCIPVSHAKNKIHWIYLIRFVPLIIIVKAYSVVGLKGEALLSRPFG